MITRCQTVDMMRSQTRCQTVDIMRKTCPNPWIPSRQHSVTHISLLMGPQWCSTTGISPISTAHHGALSHQHGETRRTLPCARTQRAQIPLFSDPVYLSHAHAHIGALRLNLSHEHIGVS